MTSLAFARNSLGTAASRGYFTKKVRPGLVLRICRKVYSAKLRDLCFSFTRPAVATRDEMLKRANCLFFFCGTMAEKGTAFSHIKTQRVTKRSQEELACSQTSFTRMTLKQFSDFIDQKIWDFRVGATTMEAETGICGPRSLLTAQTESE